METLFEMDTGKGQTASVVMLDKQASAGHDETEPMVRFFEEVAREQGWQPGDGLRSHQAASVYLALMVAGELAGGLQTVPGLLTRPLPYQAVWPEVETPDPAATVHVTMLALAKEYRGRPGLFWLLCVELWRWCQAGGVTTVFLEATPATMRVYRRMGWPLEIVGDLRLHWGEDCHLCRSGIRQMEDAITLRAQQSALYQGFIEQACRGKK